MQAPSNTIDSNGNKASRDKRAHLLAQKLKIKYPMAIGLTNLLNQNSQQIFITYLEKVFTSNISFDKTEVTQILEAIDIGAIELFNKTGKIYSSYNYDIRLKKTRRIKPHPGEKWRPVLAWRNYTDICFFLIEYVSSVVKTKEGFDFIKRNLDFDIASNNVKEVVTITTLITSIEKDDNGYGLYNEEKQSQAKYIELFKLGCEHLQNNDKNHNESINRKSDNRGESNNNDVREHEKSLEITIGWISILTNYFYIKSLDKENKEDKGIDNIGAKGLDRIAHSLSLDEILGYLSPQSQYIVEEGYRSFNLNNILELVFYSFLLNKEQITNTDVGKNAREEIILSVAKIFGVEALDKWYRQSVGARDEVVNIHRYLFTRAAISSHKEKIEELKVINERDKLGNHLDNLNQAPNANIANDNKSGQGNRFKV